MYGFGSSWVLLCSLYVNVLSLFTITMVGVPGGGAVGVGAAVAVVVGPECGGDTHYLMFSKG